MARLADLLTQASGGRLVFDRFHGGIIVADAIYADIEPKAGQDEGALYVNEEIFIEGNVLNRERYTSILPPFDGFWIEAKSAQHKGAWLGALCRAYHNDPRFKHNEWVLSMYPVTALERGGGRLQVICPNTMQIVFLDKNGNLLTQQAMLHQATNISHVFRSALRLPPLVIDISVNCAPLVLETLALMGCANVATEVIAPPPALSKSHEDKHGVPLSSYKVLKFRGRNLSERAGSPAYGTRSAPREHRVRRHYRWRGHLKLLIEPYLRGNPLRGRVATSYEVEPDEAKD